MATKRATAAATTRAGRTRKPARRLVTWAIAAIARGPKVWPKAATTRIWPRAASAVRGLRPTWSEEVSGKRAPMPCR